jgi:hypothetical protein
MKVRRSSVTALQQGTEEGSAETFSPIAAEQGALSFWLLDASRFLIK